MAVRFLGDNWLMASAIVGFLRACQRADITGWESWIKGRILEVPKDIWQRAGEILGEVLFELGYKDYKTRLAGLIKSKKPEIKNPYSSLILPLIGDFHNNSILTNPSSIKSFAGHIEEWFRSEVLEDCEEDQKLKQKLAQLVSNDTNFRRELKEKIKNAISEALKELNDEGKEQNSEDAPLCFFCRERKTYKYKNRWRTFDAVHFTPLSASPETVANFFYNGENNMYLCKECEKLIFFSSLAYTKTNNTYIFVYLPDDLMQIYHINNRLLGDKTINDDFLKSALALQFIEGKKEEAVLAYRNIYIIEIQKVSEAQANIYLFTFNKRIISALYRYLEKYPKELFGSVFDVFLDYMNSSRSLYEFINYILYGFFFKERYKDSGVSFVHRLVRLGVGLKFLPRTLTYFIKVQEYLEKEDIDMAEKQIKWAYSEGQKLRKKLTEEYGEEMAKKRLQTLSYRILEAVRRKDTDAFAQSIIRAYLELESEVPALFKEALLDKSFNRIAYAFLIGLNGGDRSEKGAQEEAEPVLGEE